MKPLDLHLGHISAIDCSACILLPLIDWSCLAVIQEATEEPAACKMVATRRGVRVYSPTKTNPEQSSDVPVRMKERCSVNL